MNFLKRSRRRKRRRHISAPILNTEIDLLRKLWMLRYISFWGRNGTFIEKYGFEDERIAQALGFSEVSDDGDFNPSFALRELKKLTRAAEAKSSEARLPEVLTKNLKKLSEHIPLTKCEQWILGFAVIAQEGSELQSVVGKSPEVNRSTLGALISFVLGLPKSQVASALDKNGSLYGSGLLKNECWEAKGDVTEYLTPLNEEFAIGLAHEDTEIANLFQSAFRIAPAASLGIEDYDHLRDDIQGLLVHARKSLENKRRGVNYLLHGAPGTGKTELSRLVAGVLKLPLHEIVVADEDGDSISVGQRTSAFKSAQTFLRFADSIIAFDEADEVLGGSSSFSGIFVGMRGPRNSSVSKAWINRTLEENIVPTIWISNETQGVDRAILRRFDRIIEVPVPPQQQRERFIKKLVPNSDPKFSKALAASPNLTPGVVQKGVEFASSVVESAASDRWRKIALDAINGTLRGQGIPSIRINDPTMLPDFYDIDLINADSELQSIARRLRDLGSSRICLYGPPGTGKTAFVRWIAEDQNCSLTRVNASDLLGCYVGETEQNIRRAFEHAERSGSILLFDEIDSFLFSRERATQPWQVSQVNEFLTQLESYSGKLFATTNNEKILDEASLRRFDLKVGFKYLKPNQVEVLVCKCCAELGLDAPPREQNLRLRSVQNLALGDFATLMRRSNFNGFDSTQKLIDALVMECSMKHDYRQSIGFD